MIIDVYKDDSLKTDTIVPSNSVNLAYYSVRNPKIEENIQIANILESTRVQYVEIKKPGQTINSRFFLLSDKYVDEGEIIPLYYTYKLQYNINNANDNIKITLISDKGPIPIKYKLKYDVNYISENTYSIEIFTNYYMDTTVRLYAIYNAMIPDKNGIPKLSVDFKEQINPYPYMRESQDQTGNLREYNIELCKDDINSYIITTPTSNTYYLFPLDGKNIKAKVPINIDNNWFTRITNGYISRYFQSTKVPENVVYTINDYYNQTFSDMGAPYMRITETASIIGKSTIKINNTPIYITIGDNKKIDNVIVTIGNSIVDIASIDAQSGIINIVAILNPNDDVKVEYTYIEDSCIYKGYTVGDEMKSVFVPLDLNPGVGHEYGFIDEDGNIIIEPSFRLLNKTICIYAKPSSIKVTPISIQDETIEIPYNHPFKTLDITLSTPIMNSGYNIKVKAKYSNVPILFKDGTTPADMCAWGYIEGSNDKLRLYNSNILDGEPITVNYLSHDTRNQAGSNVIHRNTGNILFHTIGEIDSIKSNMMRAILIAKIYVRPNSSIDMVNLIDTRSKGGGLIDISNDIREKINPESQYYLDIGCVDGEPLQENAVFIVRINKNLLKQNGGNLTENDINNAVAKYKAFGVLPIVQFIDPDNHVKIV